MLPKVKPSNPNFSSGPCSKRPGYDVSQLDLKTLGRSHRSSVGKAALEKACVDTARLLGLPEGYRVGVVPASDTGAMEMAMWSLLGPRPVDIFAWESFGKEWVNDVTNQLKLPDVNVYSADYGKLPDLTRANPEHDIIFTWNGTTSGVKVPDANWLRDDRKGIVICDATSAVFAMPMAWEKLDVITFSWQKVLGGEGAHGMLILSPRAAERLESWTPPWPMPKIFRLTRKGKLNEDIFKGSTINTPSMLCVADYLDALQWVEDLGGMENCIRKSLENLAVVEAFVARHDWIDFLAELPETRSNTSVCLKLNLNASQIRQFTNLLEEQGVAHDIGSYRDAPPGIRIWCGSTVEKSDLEALMPWIQWAYEQVK